MELTAVFVQHSSYLLTFPLLRNAGVWRRQLSTALFLIYDRPTGHIEIGRVIFPHQVRYMDLRKLRTIQLQYNTILFY